MIVYLSNWLTLFPIAFSLFVMLQLSQANTDNRRASLGILCMRLAIVILFVLSIGSIGLRFSVLSINWLIIACVFSLILYFKHRKLSRSAVTLAMLSCRDDVQLQTAAAFFHEEQSGWLGRRLARFRKLIAQGVDSALALETVGFTRSVYEKLTARLLYRYGSNLQTREQLLLPSRVEFEVERLLGRLAILGWVALIAPYFVLFQAVIVPTLFKILEEFGTATPWALAALARYGTLGSIIATLVPLTVLIVFGSVIFIWIYPPLAQQLPFRWICEAYFRSLGCIAFAQVAEKTEEPIDALRATAEMLPVKYLSQRFERAASGVEGGMTLVDAVSSAGLIRPKQLSDFSSQLDTSGLAWASGQLASFEVERMLYRYSILIQWVLVAVTLFVGAFVALVSIGLLQSLTEMIYTLGPTS